MCNYCTITFSQEAKKKKNWTKGKKLGSPCCAVIIIELCSSYITFVKILKSYNVNCLKKKKEKLGRIVKKMPIYEISFTIFNFISVNVAVDDNFLACWD